MQGEIVPYLYLRGYHRVTGAGRENMGLQIGNKVQTKGKTRKGKREFSGRFPLFGFDTHRFSLPCSNIDEARFQYIIGYCDDPVCPIVFPPTVRDPIVFFFFFTLFFTPRQHAWQISVYWASRILTINKFNLETSIPAFRLQTACLLTSTGRQYTQMTA